MNINIYIYTSWADIDHAICHDNANVHSYIRITFKHHSLNNTNEGFCEMSEISSDRYKFNSAVTTVYIDSHF